MYLDSCTPRLETHDLVFLIHFWLVVVDAWYDVGAIPLDGGDYSFRRSSYLFSFIFFFTEDFCFSERKPSYSLRLDPHLLCLDCDEGSRILKIMKLFVRSSRCTHVRCGPYGLKFLK